ncbi:uncharacterized protein LOC141903421 [Tubulanus polymorphus]|uniref:uncharacterized protein LOC141903421 n=1 Tax=Tubulanus polymorphus TaxID=672921 RepID=UPI003DA31289
MAVASLRDMSFIHGDGTDDLTELLHRGAVTGSKRYVKKALNSGICIDNPNEDGQTALFGACYEGHEMIVEYLLQHGADPNKRSSTNATPVHAACYSANIRIMEKIVEAGGDLRLHDINQRSPKDWALMQPDLKKRRKILEFIEKIRLSALNSSNRKDTTMEKLNSSTTSRNKLTATANSIIDLFKSLSTHSNDNNLNVQNSGFGQVYYDKDTHGTIASIPLVEERLLKHNNNSITFNNGPYMVMESMFWNETSVTAKRLHRSPPSGGVIDLLIHENRNIAKLRHPNILLLMGICQTDNLENLVLLYESVALGSLYHYLHERFESMSKGDVNNVSQQIVSAVIFLQEHNITHCNITSHAVQLVSPFIAKLSNFEYAIQNDCKIQFSAAVYNKYANAVYNWMAPEVMDGEPPTNLSDLYSFCVVMWEMFQGEVPWNGMSAEAIRHTLLDDRECLSVYEDSIPLPYSTMIEWGLNIHPDRRKISFDQLQQMLITCHNQKEIQRQIDRDLCRTRSVHETERRNKQHTVNNTEQQFDFPMTSTMERPSVRRRGIQQDRDSRTNNEETELKTVYSKEELKKPSPAPRMSKIKTPDKSSSYQPLEKGKSHPFLRLDSGGVSCNVPMSDTVIIDSQTNYDFISNEAKRDFLTSQRKSILKHEKEVIECAGDSFTTPVKQKYRMVPNGQIFESPQLIDGRLPTSTQKLLSYPSEPESPIPDGDQNNLNTSRNSRLSTGSACSPGKVLIKPASHQLTHDPTVGINNPPTTNLPMTNDLQEHIQCYRSEAFMQIKPTDKVLSDVAMQNGGCFTYNSPASSQWYAGKGSVRNLIQNFDVNSEHELINPRQKHVLCGVNAHKNLLRQKQDVSPVGGVPVLNGRYKPVDEKKKIRLGTKAPVYKKAGSTAFDRLYKALATPASVDCDPTKTQHATDNCETVEAECQQMLEEEELRTENAETQTSLVTPVETQEFIYPAMIETRSLGRVMRLPSTDSNETTDELDTFEHEAIERMRENLIRDVLAKQTIHAELTRKISDTNSPPSTGSSSDTAQSQRSVTFSDPVIENKTSMSDQCVITNVSIEENDLQPVSSASDQSTQSSSSQSQRKPGTSKSLEDLEEFYFDDVITPSLYNENHMRLQATMSLDAANIPTSAAAAGCRSTSPHPAEGDHLTTVTAVDAVQMRTVSETFQSSHNTEHIEQIDQRAHEVNQGDYEGNTEGCVNEKFLCSTPYNDHNKKVVKVIAEPGYSTIVETETTFDGETTEHLVTASRTNLETGDVDEMIPQRASSQTIVAEVRVER